MRLLIVAGLASSVAMQAVAQQNTPAPAPTPPPTPIKRPSSAFPKIKLGGVKSKAPRPIGSVRGSLLPPPPPPGAGGSHQHSGTPGAVVGGRGDSIRDGQRIGNGPRSGDNNRPDRTENRGEFRDSTGRNTPRDGVSIDGRYDDDRFRLGFHVGSGLSAHHHGRRVHYGYPYGYPYGYGGIGYGYGYGSSWYDGYDATPIRGYRYPDTYVESVPVAPVAPPEPLSTLEKADVALSESRSKDAVKLFQEHLKTTPNDAEATRSLALALLLEKRHKEAVAVMIGVYEKHHGLAAQVIESDNLPRGEAGLRTLVLAVVPYANRTKTASGYLTTAVLLQAQGKTDAALRLLTKAKDAGLDERIASEMEVALKP
ncbi:MAG: hypothetical protein H7210_00225 [Pyrinomonadaceae bacterium]|nr:hypothetical protein [Phycisphaerales bacterium]